MPTRKMGVDTLEILAQDSGPYDLIYSNQVFEHLEAPLQILKQLSDQLNSNGLVYIRVPDGRGVESELLKGGWRPELDAIHPLEHINCFTRKSLIGMAQRAGLKHIQAPLRLDMTQLLGGLKREFNDRWLTTHLFFRRP